MYENLNRQYCNHSCQIFLLNIFLKFSSILMIFYYLAPLQNASIVMSRCMQFNFEDKREVYLLSESVLPVSKKESMREGKKSIGPRMKYGHANLNSFCSRTNKRVCIFNFSSLSLCTWPSDKCVFLRLFYNFFLFSLLHTLTVHR